MENETRELVRNEVTRELDAIETLSIGDDIIGGAIVDVTTLGRLLVDWEKNDAEIEDKNRRLKLEQTKFESEMAERKYRLRLEEEKLDLEKARFEYEVQKDLEQKKFQWIRIVLDISVGIGMPLVGYGWYNVWIKRGFAFEKDGTIVSQTFRNTFNKFRSPTRK